MLSSQLLQGHRSRFSCNYHCTFNRGNEMKKKKNCVLLRLDQVESAEDFGPMKVEKYYVNETMNSYRSYACTNESLHVT